MTLVAGGDQSAEADALLEKKLALLAATRSAGAGAEAFNAMPDVPPIVVVPVAFAAAGTIRSSSP